MTTLSGLERRTGRTDTRNLILESGLSLFNEEGIAKISTNRIAVELGISSGNLHYHFRNKNQIAEWLIRRFDDRVEAITASSESVVALDDLWLTLHLMFEAIHDYRFIYRDVDYLIRESPKIAERVRHITSRKLKSVRQMCHRLAAASVIQAETEDVDSLSLQMVFTTTCWLTFARLVPGEVIRVDAGHAAYQVLTLLAPYLEPNSRAYLTYLRSKYVKHER
jgi:AcrR family transcriptional regulator